MPRDWVTSSLVMNVHRMTNRARPGGLAKEAQGCAVLPQARLNELLTELRKKIGQRISGGNAGLMRCWLSFKHRCGASKNGKCFLVWKDVSRAWRKGLGDFWPSHRYRTEPCVAINRCIGLRNLTNAHRDTTPPLGIFKQRTRLTSRVMTPPPKLPQGYHSRSSATG